MPTARHNEMIARLIAERDALQTDRDRLSAALQEQNQAAARHNETIAALITEREVFRADRDRIEAARQEQLGVAAKQNEVIGALIAERDAFRANCDRLSAARPVAKHNETIAALITEREVFRADRDRIEAARQEQLGVATKQNEVIETLIAERNAFRANCDRSESALAAIMRGQGPFLTADAVLSHLRRGFPQMGHDERVRLFRLFCETIGPYYVDNPSYNLVCYEIAEQTGLHVLPVTTNSPIATIDQVKLTADDDLLFGDFGLYLRHETQAQFFASDVVPHIPEIADLGFSPMSPDTHPWLGPEALNPHDAVVLYGILRSLRPKTVVALGGGPSTALINRAIEWTGAGRLITLGLNVDNPGDEIQGARVAPAWQGRKQDLSVFEALEKNDILFVTGAYTIKPGSDLEFLLFNVLPNLKPGVLVHFDHVYLPRRSPIEHYIVNHWHWNHAYALAAYLAGNRDWEVVIANSFVSESGNSAIAEAVIHGLSAGDPGRMVRLQEMSPGSSFWFRKSN
jgi:hypothetical protein